MSVIRNILPGIQFICKWIPELVTNSHFQALSTGARHIAYNLHTAKWGLLRPLSHFVQSDCRAIYNESNES